MGRAISEDNKRKKKRKKLMYFDALVELISLTVYFIIYLSHYSDFIH